MTETTLQQIVSDKCKGKNHKGLPEHFIPLLNRLDAINKKFFLGTTNNKFTPGETLEFKGKHAGRPNSAEYAYQVHVVINNICRFVLIDRFPGKLSFQFPSDLTDNDVKGVSGLSIGEYFEQVYSLDSERKTVPYINENTLEISEFYLDLLEKIIDIFENSKAKDCEIPLGKIGNIPGVLKNAIKALKPRIYIFTTENYLTSLKAGLAVLDTVKDISETEVPLTEEKVDENLTKLQSLNKNINGLENHSFIKRLAELNPKDLSDEDNETIGRLQSWAKSLKTAMPEKNQTIFSRLHSHLKVALSTKVQAMLDKPVAEIQIPKLAEPDTTDAVLDQISSIENTIKNYENQDKVLNERITELKRIQQKNQMTAPELSAQKKELDDHIDLILKQYSTLAAEIPNKTSSLKDAMQQLNFKKIALEISTDKTPSDAIKKEMDVIQGKLKSQKSKPESKLQEPQTNLDDSVSTSPLDSSSASLNSSADNSTVDETEIASTSSDKTTDSSDTPEANERLDRLRSLKVSLDQNLKTFESNKKEKTERNNTKAIVRSIYGDNKTAYKQLLKDLKISTKKSTKEKLKGFVKTSPTTQFAEKLGVKDIKTLRTGLLSKVNERIEILDAMIKHNSQNTTNNNNAAETKTTAIVTNASENEVPTIDVEQLTQELQTLENKYASRIIIESHDDVKVGLLDVGTTVSEYIESLKKGKDIDVATLKNKIDVLNVAIKKYNDVLATTKFNDPNIETKVHDYVKNSLGYELNQITNAINGLSASETITSLRDYVTNTSVHIKDLVITDPTKFDEATQILVKHKIGVDPDSAMVKATQINNMSADYSVLLEEILKLEMPAMTQLSAIDNTTIKTLSNDIDTLTTDIQNKHAALIAERNVYGDANIKIYRNLRDLVEQYPNKDEALCQKILQGEGEEGENAEDLSSITNTLIHLANEKAASGVKRYSVDAIKNAQTQMYDAIYKTQQEQSSKLTTRRNISFGLAIILSPTVIPAIVALGFGLYYRSQINKVKENGLEKVETTVGELSLTKHVTDNLNQNVVPENLKKDAVVNTTFGNTLKRLYQDRDTGTLLSKDEIKSLEEADKSKHITIFMKHNQAERYKAKVELAHKLEKADDEPAKVLKALNDFAEADSKIQLKK